MPHCEQDELICMYSLSWLPTCNHSDDYYHFECKSNTQFRAQLHFDFTNLLVSTKSIHKPDD